MPCPWVPRPRLAARALLPHPHGRPSRHLCSAWQGLAPSCVLAVPTVLGEEDKGLPALGGDWIVWLIYVYHRLPRPIKSVLWLLP